MNTHWIILFAALVIILSFTANLISQKTNIPSVLMLMLIGLGLQQFVQVDQEVLRPYLEILGTVGVVLIVLEASLDLHLAENKWSLIWRATALAVVGLVITAGLISMLLVVALGLDMLTALLYAVPLSVLSSAIIIPSVGKLKEHPREFLIFESAMSDILGIVFFYALLDFYRQGGTADVVAFVGAKIIFTLILSVGFSYGLILLFQSLRGTSIRLFLLIAILVGLYAAGKLLHLSPLILILVFGLTLNNKQLFFQGSLHRMVNHAQFDSILKDLRFITLESAFVVRTFFFVAFGMSILLGSLLHLSVLAVSLLALGIIYGVRLLGLKALSPEITQPAIYVAPRGLITVLLFYAIPQDAASELFQPGIILLTILFSSFVMTYGLIRERKLAQQAKAARKAASERAARFKEADLPGQILPQNNG
jgi:Kef-type K+ transport system membrane component KefB